MNGLSAQEAQKKLLEFGLNEIPEAKTTPWWRIFGEQFTGFVTVILLSSSLVSFFIKEYVDAFFIILIVILNGLLGFYQELKAQKDIKALKTLVTSSCRVLRDGREILLPTKFLVPGDVVVLGTGDKVPADGILIFATKLSLNESMLTGESVPIDKTTQDQVFMATQVLCGHARMQISETGKNTRFGSIATSLSQIIDEKTPLEELLNAFSKKLGYLILVATAIMFVIGIVQGRAFYYMFLQSVSLAVAFIPEGLPAVFTITLAIGMQRMAKQKAVMRKLATTEGLGSANIICTDKTGTLTKNEMMVKEIFLANGQEYEVTGAGYSSDGEIMTAGPASQVLSGGCANFYSASDSLAKREIDLPTKSSSLAIDEASKNLAPSLQRLIEIGVLCNSSSLVLKEDGKEDFDVLGDTTEGALLVLAKKAGINAEDLKANFAVVEEFPFEAQRMLMTVIVQTTDNSKQLTENEKKTLVFTKGAPEKVMDKCTNLSDKEKIGAKITEFSQKGLRVLGLAFKEINKSSIKQNEAEENLTFLGIVGIYDPPRLEVKDAIETARRAGIRTVMITGDNPLTALAIAREIGLTQKESEVVTGEQLEQFSEEIFNQKINEVNIFARVAPEDKLRIVQALQKTGNVVAVTGDGVNDAPALKKADVGVAMGKTGTDVAKEASDMIILDDNFATLVKAIEEGRMIYDNILKAIRYLLSSNLGESLTVIFALLLGWQLPLIPQQILWINLVTDGLPALAMAFDPRDPGVMQRQPRGRSGEIVSFSDWKKLFLVGLVESVLALCLFKFVLASSGLQSAQLSTFTILVVIDMLVAFLIRGKKQNPFNNKVLLLAVGTALLAQIIILATPFLRLIFTSG